MTSGFFITFEGTEAVGKSTQIQLLSANLRLAGIEPLLLREPGGTSVGEEIRNLVKHNPRCVGMSPQAELLLMSASRAQLVEEVLRPQLANGRVILCDRFYDSTIAYQGYGRGLNLSEVRAAIELAIGNVRPNLTVLLTLSDEVRQARLSCRASKEGTTWDRMEEAGREFFKRVEYGYDQLALKEPERIKRVRADGEPEAIAQEILKLVRSAKP